MVEWLDKLAQFVQSARRCVTLERTFGQSDIVYDKLITSTLVSQSEFNSQRKAPKVTLLLELLPGKHGKQIMRAKLREQSSDHRKEYYDDDGSRHTAQRKHCKESMMMEAEYNCDDGATANRCGCAYKRKVKA